MAKLKSNVRPVRSEFADSKRLHSYIGLMMGDGFMDIKHMDVSQFRLDGYPMESIVDPNTGASIITVPKGATKSDRAMFDSLVLDNPDLLMADSMEENKQQIRQFIAQYKREYK